MKRLLCTALTGIALLAPAATQANDQETAQAIAERMRASGQMRGYSVGVKVQEGTAWLGGTVATQEQMATAMALAKQVDGVDRVVNNLTIVPPPTARKTSGPLHQPNSISGERNGMPTQAASSRRNNKVIPAAAELPDHAEQELMMGGPNAVEMPDNLSLNARIADAGITEGTRIAMAQPAVRRAPLPLAQAQPMPYMAVEQPGAARAQMEPIAAPQPMPMHVPTGPGAVAPYHYDHPQMPGYAWPAYAAHPNYAAVTYPKQYSPTAWPYIGPFYPYPQVPLGWRKVTLEWDDGWWFLDFKDSH